MLVLLSPAKKFDFSNIKYSKLSTEPIFRNEANELASLLKTFSADKISGLMNISTKLGELNYERFKKYSFTPKEKDLKQAALAFAGDTFVGLDAKSIKKENFDFLQKHIRIISGLYGLLRPLDNIQVYRLEMGSKLHTNKGNDLYSFWDTKIAEKLNEEIKLMDDSFFVNLASEEYFKPVKNRLDRIVITPKFYNLKDGKLKMISFLAKKCRGRMARFIVENKITNIEELHRFSDGGYFFNKELSKDKELIFVKE